MQLMRHQEEGVGFLLAQGSGLLAFEQGLGKTLVAIEAFQRLLQSAKAKRLVVVCPNHLKRNWVAELDKFARELDAEIIEGRAAVRRRALSRTVATVVIMSYETARAEITGVIALLKRALTVLVLDECHAVKNRGSLTSTAAQHFAPAAAYRWLLSGTPVTNRAVDLYAQIGIVAAGSPLGSYESFVDTYDDNPSSESSTGSPNSLGKRVAPYLLRRTKEQCLDLPEKTFVDIRVELPEWQRRLYDDVRDGIVREVEPMSGDQFRIFAGTALTRLLRLSQIASNPQLVFPGEVNVPGKVIELDSLIDEIVRTNGRKVILWSPYVKTIQALEQRYADVSAASLYGGTPVEERQAIAHRFQSDPALRLLVGNPAAAGSGFTLTAASFTIYESLTWRYDYYAQSQDRNHRIGQTQPVTYLRLVAVDTIEEVILAALERKGTLARSLLGDTTAPPALAEMSPKAFCEMLLANQLPKA